MYTYVPNFTQISLFCHHWEAKPPIFPHCQPWHPVVAPSSSVESRLNVCTQPQSFPYPTISKPFRSSNTFWTKSFSQALPLESVTDRQTDRHIKKQHFSLAQRHAKSDPHQTWHDDRGLRARSCTSKTFWSQIIVLPLGGAENLGVTEPSQIKTPVTLEPL